MECMKALGVRRATLGAASLSATLFTSTYFAKASCRKEINSDVLALSTLCAGALSYKEKTTWAVDVYILCNKFLPKRGQKALLGVNSG